LGKPEGECGWKNLLVVIVVVTTCRLVVVGFLFIFQSKSSRKKIAALSSKVFTQWDWDGNITLQNQNQANQGQITPTTTMAEHISKARRLIRNG